MRPLQSILDAASAGNVRKRVQPTDLTPSDLLGNSNKMRRLLEGDRQHLASGQNKLNAPSGVAPSPGALNDFRFASITPDQFAPHVIPPSMANVREQNANARVPLSRMMHAFPHQPMLQLPGKNELAIIKKSTNKKEDNIKIPSGQSQDIFNQRGQQNLVNSFIGLNNNVNGQEMLNGHTIQGATPGTWNPTMTNEFKSMFQNPAKYEKYMSLTPSGVWHGDDDLPAITGWSFDGVVRIEESAEGRSTRETDGFETFTLGANRPTRPKTSAKIETIVQAGSQEILDYGESKGLMEGARMWGRLSKVPLADSNGTRQRFIISAKSGVLSIPAEGVTQDITVMNVAEMRALLTAAGNHDAAARLKHPLRPFMWQFFYTPAGESPHPSMYEYEDEEGIMHYDALLCPLGRVEFGPIKYHLLPASTAGDIKPLTNGYTLMIRHFLTLLIDPLKDGIFANI